MNVCDQGHIAGVLLKPRCVSCSHTKYSDHRTTRKETFLQKQDFRQKQDSANKRDVQAIHLYIIDFY